MKIKLVLRKIKYEIYLFAFESFLKVFSFLGQGQGVVSLNSYKELLRLFKWDKEPILDETQVHAYEHVLDVNQRRLRDAESIMTVCRNAGSQCILEIGTANGVTTFSMAQNSPVAKIYTINILPEEAESGTGGTLITGAFQKKFIGSYFREKNISNIYQIYANTRNWEPNIGQIDVAFIDGCHDRDFVINDTLLVLPYMRPGGFILWHDFNPELAASHNWIAEVCQAVMLLRKQGYISGNVYHVKDSWVGIWQVPYLEVKE